MIKRQFLMHIGNSIPIAFAVLCLLLTEGCQSDITDKKTSIRLQNDFFCSAGPVEKLTDQKITLNPASPKAKAVIQNVLAFSGVPMNITIYEGKVGNALATEDEGQKMIIYNEKFLDEVDKKSGSYWQSVFLIAHEIGHLLSDHFRKRNPKLNHQKELDADKFAGYILYRLQADKNQCSWIMNTSLLQDSKGSITHPPKNKRIEYINAGYDLAFKQSFNIPDPPPPVVDEEDLGEAFECINFSQGEINTYYTLDYPTCGFEEAIMTKKENYKILAEEPLFSEYIIRDTIVGVILKLESPEYSENSGWLYRTSAIIRMKEYNKNINLSLKSEVIIVSGITDPGRSEGGSYRFAKYFKAGQRIKFLVSPVSTEGIVPVQKMNYLKFLPPDQ